MTPRTLSGRHCFAPGAAAASSRKAPCTVAAPVVRKAAGASALVADTESVVLDADLAAVIRLAGRNLQPLRTVMTTAPPEAGRS
jgi:hypothetical protein